tara:strand:- start:202 stop:306 length:105 start_codon:yes stop_codon:yes gene_type:complete
MQRFSGRLDGLKGSSSLFLLGLKVVVMPEDEGLP